MATIETRRPKTIEKVKWAITHLGTLGDMPIEDLDRKTCQAYVNRKSKTHAPGSVRTMVQPWSAALELAEADGIIRSNPFRHVVLPIVNSEPKKTLSVEETRKLLNASRGHSGHALIVLGCGLGLRLGEIQALRPEHFKEKGKLIVPGTKTRSAARVIPLPLTLHKELAGMKMPLLPACQTACRNALTRNRIRAGITRHIHPHLTRHTFATMLQWLGCPLDIRKRLLGHAKGDVTQGYSHAEWEEWSKWLELLVTHVYGEFGNSFGNAPETMVQKEQIS